MFYNLDIKTIIITILSVSISGYLIYLTYEKFKRTKNQFNSKTLDRIRNRGTKKSLYLIKKVLLLLIIILITVTILRPKWGIESEKRDALGIDIVFTLDISESMKALDYSEGSRKINRLETAKEMITNFVQDRPGDRFSLVVFAGEAFVSCPMTIDHNAFLTFLQNISFDEISLGGTNIDAALKASLDRFIKNDDDKKRSKVVILITDGENQESNYDKIIDIAKNDGIQIFTIGLGSKEGSLIPLGTDVFGRTQYKQYQGEMVKTFLDETVLKDIANKTGAEYFNPEDSQDLMKIHEQIEKLTKSEIEVEDQDMQKEQFSIFIIMAFILWMGFIFLPENI